MIRRSLMEMARDRSYLPEGYVGRCVTCRLLVSGREYEERTHPCRPMTLDYSLGFVVNPDNRPWEPGYSFSVDQGSGARTGHKCRGNVHRSSRVYRVGFVVGLDYELIHVEGPRPTDETVERLERKLRERRPGSNWYPGCEDE